ncbi:hypothetical protein GEV27_03940 [Aeromicrobium sp. S22]|uniref:hypothetical protein n=1 Tax=Aeromicrobium sp. S22 TaxID=2662029 RepID=UPI00129D5644|nr:hypothetical protein [Aeromicrobium sp. S22]MRK00666.1 hypothetical protein [Aeromicrobium sp. S22]
MSQSASSRRKPLLLLVVALAVAALVAVAVWRLGGDDDVSPLAAGPSGEPTSASPSPEASTTPAPEKTSPKAEAPEKCEGPDTQFNVEGIRQESLLPDCGAPAPVTPAEQKKSGLGLSCGGSYPVILYKTTTTGAKTSICGKTSSGEEFRFVTQADGGDTVDVKGEYDPQLDAFVAKKDGVSYAVQAYDGTLVVTKDGRTTKQKSSDWISLDNESDYD